MYPCIVVWYDGGVMQHKEFHDSSDAQDYRDELINRQCPVTVLWLETKITEL